MYFARDSQITLRLDPPIRFFDVDVLYTHLQKEHFNCFICNEDRPSENKYYDNYGDCEFVLNAACTRRTRAELDRDYLGLPKQRETACRKHSLTRTNLTDTAARAHTHTRKYEITMVRNTFHAYIPTASLQST